MKFHRSHAPITRGRVRTLKTLARSCRTTHSKQPPTLRSVPREWFQGLKKAAQRAASSLATAGLAVALLLSPGAASAETTYVTLPASVIPGVFAAQKTMVEAWTIVGEAFVDDEFNGHDWQETLRSHMMSAYATLAPEEAMGEISKMLVELGDPYTRLMPAEDYAQFKVSAEGEMQGVGLLIANEGEGGRLLVLAPIKGGPADRAGIIPGDEVTDIDGKSTKGLTGEQAAKLLRGQGGTQVDVRLVRHVEGPAVFAAGGIPSSSELLSTPRLQDSMNQIKELSLRRERVALSPVYSTALHTGDGHTVGYVRLTQFSSNAAADMSTAIQGLEAAGAENYILDLRQNPGGLVQSSIDIAHLWMDGHSVVFNISGREGSGTSRAVVEEEGPALTHAPLVVLVNDQSASASEILSGALKDNARALIVGDKPTYGKGRIQSVFELEDGSALFVTVAKYVTPLGTVIDHQGIRPDKSCTPLGSTTPPAVFMPGVPVGPGSEELFLSQLRTDSCVLAAEQAMQKMEATQPALTALLHQKPSVAPPLHTVRSMMAVAS